jgi:hypothetical protein
MYRYFAIYLFMFFPLTIQAGWDGDPAGAAQTGTGGISVFTNGIWSIHNNPAGLAKLQNPMTGLYIENRFLLKELFFNAGALALPVQNGGLGIAVSQLSSGQYLNTFAGLAFGRRFGERFSAGVRLDCHHVSFGSEHEQGTAVSFDAGLQWALSDAVTFACNLFNPTRVKRNIVPDEPLPSILRAGFSYRPLPELTLMVEAGKTSEAAWVVNYGMEYVLDEKLFVRAGLGSDTSTFSFGCGYLFDAFTVDVAASWHQTLGFTPSASLTYTFSR